MIDYSFQEVEEIFSRFYNANPDPKGELDYTNSFTLLVAVVLSAQSTDKSVNKATRILFQEADTPDKILSLGEDRLKDIIKIIGLYQTKAKNIIALSRILSDQYGSEVPSSYEALVALPGVGRKTANVVRNIAFGHPVIAIDTHIFRLGNRLGIAPGKTPEAVEKGLLTVIPSQYRRQAHHWLILHGRYVCKARRPSCNECLIVDLCKSTEKNHDAITKESHSISR